MGTSFSRDRFSESVAEDEPVAREGVFVPGRGMVNDVDPERPWEEDGRGVDGRVAESGEFAEVDTRSLAIGVDGRACGVAVPSCSVISGSCNE
jgi:hypothetical protein